MTQSNGIDPAENSDLEALLEAAHAQAPQMPNGLAARIVEDALAVMPRVPWYRRWPARALAAIGGPAGLGGLVTATVAGFWLGIAPPADTVDPLVWVGAADSTAEVYEDEELADLVGTNWFGDEG